MRSSSIIAAAAALVTSVLAATGPCIMDDYTCEPVLDASFCYNSIALGWEGASTNPADVFKCVDPPELVSLGLFPSFPPFFRKDGWLTVIIQMCSYYGCADTLDELVTKNNLCPYNGTSVTS